MLRPVISLDRIFVEDPVRMIRAVKYSATTGAHMPFVLRHKIRHSASLLGSVSPSRITEELLKIINSGCMFDIVQEAIDTNIYNYLQPAACSFICNDKRFEDAYMEKLKRLDALSISDSGARLGKKLAFLISDFVCLLTDWEKEIAAGTPVAELYAKTWSECRHFVLPMNPQRTELEFAVRLVLKELGVQVRSQKRRKINGL